MRMAELCSTSGVAPATIKWYLRIGLLPKGTSTSRNQADYGPAHVRRLRLVRALLEVGGFSIAQAQSVLASLDDPTVPIEAVVKSVHGALARSVSHPIDPAMLEYVDHYLAHREWTVDRDSPARDDLAAALSAMNEIFQISPVATYSESVEHEIFDALDHYAGPIETWAHEEIASLTSDDSGRMVDGPGTPATERDRDELIANIVLGTVLMERSIGALRRLAQEHFFMAASSR